MNGNRRLLLVLALVVVAAPAAGQGRRRPAGVTPPAVYAPLRPSLTPTRALVAPGFRPRVRVARPTRLDWAFAVPPGRPDTTSATASATYLPMSQSYQLYVPPGYTPLRPTGLVLFVSENDTPDEFKLWEPICRKLGIVYASPYGAGRSCPTTDRVRIVLDVLDDVRRRLNVDTDRAYLAGMGEGARTACAVAFALPEACGGVLAAGAAGSPRREPWLRERARERLSVALLSGEGDPGRAEQERCRLPLLRDCEVRARLWPDAWGDGPPLADKLEEALLWLEADAARRRGLAVTYPTSRLSNSGAPVPAVWARLLLQEAAERLRQPEKTSALMQLQGIVTRWPGSAAAAEAERLLDAYNERARTPWQGLYAEVQQQFAYRQARALGAYLLGGALPERDRKRKAELVRQAIKEWELVARYGPGTKMGREAKTRVAELRRLLAKEGG
jgi:hypothetical protein